MTKIIATTDHGGMIPGKIYEVGDQLAKQLISMSRARKEGDPAPRTIPLNDEPPADLPNLPDIPDQKPAPIRRGRKPRK